LVDVFRKDCHNSFTANLKGQFRADPATPGFRFAFKMKKALAIFILALTACGFYSLGAAPTNGLLAHWTFDEASFASGVRDATGVYDGVAVNATRVAGKVGAGALSLNGSNAYVLVGGQGTALQLTNTPYTIAWWQKWGGPTSSIQNMYAMDEGADYNAGYSAYLSQGGGSMVIVHNDGVTQGWFGATTTDQNWRHYAITYSGTQQRLYIDGVFSRAHTVSGSIRPDDDPFVIGALRLQNGVFINFFKGIIDDFRIYSVALTDQEVGTLVTQPGVPSEAAIANYPLDGNAVDISGNGLNGAVLGATPSTNRFGANQSAFSFNGTSDYINCGNPAAFNFADNFTISAWVKLNGLQLAKYIVAKYDGFSSPHSYGLATQDGTAQAYAFVSLPTGGFVAASGGASLNDSKWHSLNFVYDNAIGIRLYVDGALVASRAAIGSGPFTNSLPLTIGGLTNGQFFGGQIDDVKIYNRALPTTEVQSRFNAEKQGLVARYDFNGNAQDLSGNGLNGTVVGTTDVADRFGKPNSAFNFNGSTDYIDLGNRPEFNFTRNFTLTAWAKLNGSQFAKYILAKYADFGGGVRSPRSYGLGTEDFTSRAYGFVSSDGPGFAPIAGGNPMNDDNWHAVAFSYDADSGLKLYQDGVLVASQSAPGFPAFTNSVPLMIGRAASGQFFGGLIDDVRIYSRSLSASELDTLYQSEFGATISIFPAVKLQFPTIIGKKYQVESSVDLITWVPLGSSFTATTNIHSQYVDAALNDEFYRLRVIP
jgi:hypothetical protein